MQSTLSLVSKIALVLLLAFAFLRIASPFVDEAEDRPLLNMQSEGVWTTSPVRVETAKQSYERLPTPPDPFPFKFKASATFRVLDSASFQFEGQRFRIADVQPVDRNKICLDEKGRKYACGLRAFKALDNLLRGKFVECRVEKMDENTQLARCRVNGMDVAALM